MQKRCGWFDAINASLVQGADGPARLRLVRDRKLLKSELSPVENRTCPNNTRTHHHARFDFNAPLIEFPQQPAHIANAGHAICDQSCQGTRLGITEMHVHVPQPRNDEFPFRLDHLCVRRKRDAFVFAKGRNPSAIHNERHA